LQFSHDDREESYHLQIVMKAALTGPEGAETGRLVWRNFRAAVDRGDTYAFEQQGLLKGLFATQPVVILDEMACENAGTLQSASKLITDAAHLDGNPMDEVPDETLLGWCRFAAAER